jgi:hypothetical protein
LHAKLDIDSPHQAPLPPKNSTHILRPSATTPPNQPLQTSASTSRSYCLMSLHNEPNTASTMRSRSRSSSSESSSSSSFPFDILGLPAELRLIIYEFAISHLDIASVVLDTRSLRSLAPSDRLLDAVPALSELFPSRRFEAQVREEVSDLVYKRAEFVVTLDGYAPDFTSKGRRFGAGAKKAIPGACDILRIVHLAVCINLSPGSAAPDTLRTIKWTQLPAMQSLRSIRLIITIALEHQNNNNDSSSEDEDKLTSSLTAPLRESSQEPDAYGSMMRSFFSHLPKTVDEVQFGLADVEKARWKLYT